MTDNEVATVIVDSTICVHRALGPGLLESVYEQVLEFELSSRGLRVTRQVPVAVVYRELVLEEGFRADLIVEDLVIVEVKSVHALADIHKKQLLTYLKLTNKRLGLLINFNEVLVRDGIVRVANGMPT